MMPSRQNTTKTTSPVSHTLIDALFQETWLLALTVRNAPPVTVDDALHQRCLGLVQDVQHQLMAAGASASLTDELTFAHCVFIDEVVMTQPDTDVSVWVHAPLQTRFLGKLDGGEHFYERIRYLLHCASPADALVTCYHRMLLLGYKGQYRTEAHPERLALLQQLENRLPSSATAGLCPAPVISTGKPGNRLLHVPLVQLAVLAVVTVVLWAGLRFFLLSQFAG